MLNLHTHVMVLVGACYGHQSTHQPVPGFGSVDYGRVIVIGDESWQVLGEMRETPRGKEAGALFQHREFEGKEWESVWVPFSALETATMQVSEAQQ